MMTSRRERVLAAALIGSLLMYGLAEFAGAIVLQSLQQDRATAAALTSSVAGLREQATVIEQALRNLQDLSERGLPADAGTATALYQGWLLQQLEYCEIEAAVVTPTPVITESQVGFRVPFTVQFTAPSRQTALFLDRFYATPLLHRITHLNVTGSQETDSALRVLLSMEVLAVDAALAVQSVPKPVERGVECSLAEMLSEKDIFCLAADSITTADAEGDAEPAEDAAAAPADTVTSRPVAVAAEDADPHDSVRFVASVWNGRERTAWLVDQRSQTQSSLCAAATLHLPGIEGTVLSVHEDSLRLQLNGKRCRVLLGQTLAAAVADDDTAVSVRGSGP